MLGMNAEEPIKEKSHGRLFIPSVVLPFFATFMANGIIILLLTDITTTFFGSATPSTIGIAGQLSTINSATEAIFSVVMGFLAIRFRHKPLFLAGVLLIAAAALGNFLAPTFLTMQIFFALEGIGTVLIAVTGITLLGDMLPSDRKSKAVSYTVSATFLSVTTGSLVIGYITSLGGWRYSFLLYALPISIICFALAYIGIPKASQATPVVIRRESYFKGFKQVLLNKSAFSCIVSQLPFVGSIVGIYVIAFYQYQFQISTSLASIILVVCALLMIIGSLVAGRIVNRFGRKRTTILCFLIDAVTLTAVFQMSNLWTAMIFNFVHVFFVGAAIASFNCLALDQIPQSRGTMMSMTSLFGKIGNTIAAAVAGLVLFTTYSYQISGLVFGLMTFMIVGILSFTKEPSV
jgi:MFS family permease